MYLVQTPEYKIVMITPDESRAKSVAFKLGGWIVDLPLTETIWF
jgi:hypothetical protein